MRADRERLDKDMHTEEELINSAGRRGGTARLIEDALFALGLHLKARVCF